MIHLPLLQKGRICSAHETRNRDGWASRPKDKRQFLFLTCLSAHAGRAQCSLTSLLLHFCSLICLQQALYNVAHLTIFRISRIKIATSTRRRKEPSRLLVQFTVGESFHSYEFFRPNGRMTNCPGFPGAEKVPDGDTSLLKLGESQANRAGELITL